MDETYTVGQLTARIEDALGVAFPAEVWVRGEIQDLSRPDAVDHVYFTLVDGERRASLPVVLFAANRRAVNAFMVRRGGVRMEDGTEVRIRGSVAFYPPQGRLQLKMTWIDPEYTLGRLAAERDRLLRALAAEGLLRRNGALPLPAVPLQIGLVTSAGSAAAADFLDELRSSGLGWQVTLADARVQGPEAVASLIAAIAQLVRRGVDVLAVVRGGGARTELAVFDDERLARALATAPMPVLTGIGHEIDRSVADEVAHTAYKTPTACAAGLAQRAAGYLATVEETWRRSRVAAVRRLDASGARLVAMSQRAAGATRARLTGGEESARVAGRRLGTAVEVAAGTAERSCARSSGRLEVAGRERLRAAVAATDSAAARLRALDPGRILARGWSVTRTADGALLRSVGDIRPGDKLVTTVADGEASSRVEDVAEQEGARSGG